MKQPEVSRMGNGTSSSEQGQAKSIALSLQDCLASYTSGNMC